MSYDRYDGQRRRQGFGASSNRTTLGYWVPLALTVTVATFGLVAWVWKERKDDEEHDQNRKDYRPPPGYGDVGPGHTAYAPGAQPPPQSHGAPLEDPGVVARMSGALRRTPSPQQIFDGASRRVAAGVAAAGAAVGGALSSIREEDKGYYEDHSRWSEEASTRVGATTGATSGARGPVLTSANLPSGALASGSRSEDKRKTVVIIVSAETTNHHGGENVNYHQEHASILSHLPEHIDSNSRVFIMIYAPELKQHPLASNTSSRPPPSITSSYSNIGHEDLHTPAEEVDKPLTSIDPQPVSGSQDMFQALYLQAQALVEKETMIMPFNTPTGYIQLIRHIEPDVIYIQATLSGHGGEAVKHVASLVGQVVLVVGDETGHGGLVDSEDERGAIGEDKRERWWQNDPKIGLGKGIEVVEGLRVGEDWRRRVGGHE